MPKAQKTTAKKATAKTDNSSNTIKTNEQALQEITSNQSWPLFKGAVVAAACKLYQSGQLKSGADISALLTPLGDEIREAIGIATGLSEGKQEDKLITMIVNGHSIYESLDILKQMSNLDLSVEQAKNIILAHKEDEAAWQATSLKDRYYPLLFLYEVDTWVHVDIDKTTAHVLVSDCSMAFGITEDGDKELIAFHFDPPRDYTPSSRKPPLRELLQELKARQLPAPILVGGDYQGGDFGQQQLAEFFPQSYFIPTHNSISTKVREKVDPSYGLRKEYRQMFKALYQCQTVEEYKTVVRPLIGSVGSWNFLKEINQAWRQVLCPEVVQALLALPPALRKVLCEKTPFGDEVENIKAVLYESSLYDHIFFKVILHQYYLQVLCPEWQRPVGSWKRIKDDLQSFKQTMLEAKDRTAQVEQANAPKSK